MSEFLYLILVIGIVLWLIVIIQCYSKKPSLSAETSHYTPSHVQLQLGKIAGVHSIQGLRPHMEDSYYADYNKGYFAVYDGHGGHRCSEFVCEHLHKLIYKHAGLSLSSASTNGGVSSSSLSKQLTEEEINQAITEGFKELDDNWLQIANLRNNDDGSTVVSSIIVNKVLFVAHVGDSRAVLSSSGKAIEMTIDHKPSRPEEKERIEKLGGRITFYGTWRVEGVLAVTRAIGDRRLKKYVCPIPEIRSRTLSEGDDYLILASDGVWDTLTPQNAVDIVNHSSDVKSAAYNVAMAAYNNHSLDNITCLVVDLRPYR